MSPCVRSRSFLKPTNVKVARPPACLIGPGPGGLSRKLAILDAMLVASHPRLLPSKYACDPHPPTHVGCFPLDPALRKARAFIYQNSSLAMLFSVDGS